MFGKRIKSDCPAEVSRFVLEKIGRWARMTGGAVGQLRVEPLSRLDTQASRGGPSFGEHALSASLCFCCGRACRRYFGVEAGWGELSTADTLECHRPAPLEPAEIHVGLPVVDLSPPCLLIGKCKVQMIGRAAGTGCARDVQLRSHKASSPRLRVEASLWDCIDVSRERVDGGEGRPPG